MMEGKSTLELLEIKLYRRDLASFHGSARLVALAAVLLLAIAIGSFGFAAGLASAADLERSLEASSMRWVSMGEAYEADRAEAAATAMTSRYQALALAVRYGGTAAAIASGIDADTARWSKLGEAYQAARAETAATAMTNQYKALAVRYGGTAAAIASGIDADTARWSKLGEAYQSARAEAAATAMTNRYKALAENCQRGPGTTQALLCSADYEQVEP